MTKSVESFIVENQKRELFISKLSSDMLMTITKNYRFYRSEFVQAPQKCERHHVFEAS
jgi:hypothetical protein